MRHIVSFIAASLLMPVAANAAAPDRTHFPAGVPANPAAPPTPPRPFSAAVLAGKTLYISGTTDMDPATGKPAETAEQGAKLVLEAVKRSVTAAGMTMDDLVWVQVFCSDLSYYQTFNTVYRGYFTGELPARAFLGVDHLLGGAHFEIMGIAVQKAK